MIKKSLANKICAFGFLTFGVVSQSACTTTPEVDKAAASEPVVVRIIDPKVKTEYTKDINAEKEGIDPSDHETARTEWNFGIIPKLGFNILKQEKVDNKCKIELQITSVKLDLGLPIRLLISHKASAAVIAHENGHIDICKRIYARAKEYATDCAKNALGKKFQAENADPRVALSEALRTAGQEIASPYRGLTAGQAKKVSDRYDYLCQHQKKNLPVDKLVEMSFADIEREEKNSSEK